MSSRSKTVARFTYFGAGKRSQNALKSKARPASRLEFGDVVWKAGDLSNEDGSQFPCFTQTCFYGLGSQGIQCLNPIFLDSQFHIQCSLFNVPIRLRTICVDINPSVLESLDVFGLLDTVDWIIVNIDPVAFPNSFVLNKGVESSYLVGVKA